MKKTLYVHRPLLNGNDIVEWARSQGIQKTIDPSDMHVTVAFSKSPVDWSILTPKNTKINMLINSSEIKHLGDEGACVIKFKSDILHKRWQEFLDHGASWDFPSYQSHISFTYDGSDIDTSKIKPYTGKLIFGPEIFKEVDLNWKAKVKET